MENPNRYTIQEIKYSENGADVYNITWTIPLFKKLLGTNYMKNHTLNKNTIVVAPDSKFQLRLSVFGTNNELVEIYYASPTIVFLKLECSLSWPGKKIHESSKNYQAVQLNTWQLCAALNPWQIGGYETKTLEISFTLCVSQDARVDHFNIPNPQISDDFGNLLSDGSCSDVTIKSAEGKDFRVHKIVLAFRSKVMKAHFEHNTIESTTNIVETTWETEVLRDVLAFIYTDKVSSADNDPAKLLAAADYYQLQGLKNLCEETLRNRLTVENVIETLQLAELYTANSLKKSTLEFIKGRQSKLIIETEGWKNLPFSIPKIIYEYTVQEIDSDILATALNYID